MKHFEILIQKHKIIAKMIDFLKTKEIIISKISKLSKVSKTSKL
jgi:hypothetical protein